MEIEYVKQASKQIAALNEPTKSRVEKGILKLPDGDVRKLKGYTNLYRLRIGGYRVIYELMAAKIMIYMVVPRGGAYRDI